MGFAAQQYHVSEQQGNVEESAEAKRYISGRLAYLADPEKGNEAEKEHERHTGREEQRLKRGKEADGEQSTKQGRRQILNGTARQRHPEELHEPQQRKETDERSKQTLIRLENQENEKRQGNSRRQESLNGCLL